MMIKGNITDDKIKDYLSSNVDKLKELRDFSNDNSISISQISIDYLTRIYKNFRNSQAPKIIQIMNISVCPYCNQNHINVVTDSEGKKHFYGDLDHFFDKSTFPQLSICLYNLIPVCKVCNQLKSSKKENINHPYDQTKANNIKFETSFDMEYDLAYLIGKSNNFNIIVEKSSLSAEDKAELGLFHLEKRYEQLKENVKEIIVKSKAYDKIYKEKLMQDFDLNEEELKGMIFGYNDNHLNRVLSKFNYDIMNEFNNDNP